MARQFIGHVKGEDGYTPIKGVDYFDGEKGDPGEKGEPGEKGDPGEKGEPGQDGAPGADGITPHIGENGNWFIGDRDTGQPSGGSGIVEISNEWKGKKACFLGDSITEGVNTEKTYHEFLKEIVGFSECVNLGKDGATLAYRSDKTNNIVDQLSGIPSDVDIIFIFAGTNDWGTSRVLGEWYEYSGTAGKSKRAYNSDKTTTKGALIYIAKYLYQNFPNAQFVLMTPIHRDYYQYSASTFETNYNGYGYIEDYTEAVKDCGQMFSIPVIDLRTLSGLYPTDDYNAYMYFTPNTDRLHPTAKGHEKIAKVISEQLKNIPYFVPDYQEAVFGNIICDTSELSLAGGSSATVNVSLSQSPSFAETVKISVDNENITLSDNALSFYGTSAKTMTVTAKNTSEAYTATITLSYKYVDDVSIAVSVTSSGEIVACESISLDNNTLTFTDNQSQTLTATVTPSDTTQSVTWETDYESIATVDGGVVTPKSNGTCNITVQCGDKSDICAVIVNVTNYDSDDTEKTYELKASEYGTMLQYAEVDKFISAPSSEILNNMQALNSDTRASILVRSDKEFSVTSNFSKKSTVSNIDGMYYFCARNSGMELSETNITTVKGTGTFSVFKFIDGWINVT